MNDVLKNLISISRSVGSDPLLVQGGGGNTAAKTADRNHMYIKASGTALKDMTGSAGWRRLVLDKVLSVLDDPALSDMETHSRERAIIRRLNEACEDKMPADTRPSVESTIHALMDTYSIHLHPVPVGAYVCSKEGRTLMDKLFEREEFPPMWVPYANPGYALAARVRRLMDAYRRKYGRHPRSLFLQKHGLMACGPSYREALLAARNSIGLCTKGLKKLISPATSRETRLSAGDCEKAIGAALTAAMEKNVPVVHVPDRDIEIFIKRNDARELAEVQALTPDEIVYGGGSALWLDEIGESEIEERLKQRIASEKVFPLSFIVRDKGLFIAQTGRSTGTIREVIRASLVVRMHAASFGGPVALTKKQREFIIEWEAEAFRQKAAG